MILRFRKVIGTEIYRNEEYIMIKEYNRNKNDIRINEYI